MVFGILFRYVAGQVLRSLFLALATLTAIIVLVMVMAEATRQGLAPEVVVRLIPYVIPGTLPYTIPVALLFAVSVVYGRLAGDNEVIAVKAAGCSIWTVFNPTLIVAGALAVLLWAVSGEIVPRANAAFKLALFRDTEETFYMFLKRQGEFNNPRWPIFIGVKDVDIEKRVLISPTFKHRAKGATDPNTYDVTVQAERATVRFDLTRKPAVVVAELIKPVMQGKGRYQSAPSFTFEYALPEDGGIMKPDQRVQEMTNRALDADATLTRRLLRTERSRHAVAAGLWIASGRLDQIYWPDLGNAYRNDARWKRKVFEIETEKHVRLALAIGPICFFFLGAPVGILFARRDFLSAFMTCFVPIIILYYPLVLAGVNMGKEGVLGVWSPAIVWLGDGVLLLLAALVAFPPVLKH